MTTAAAIERLTSDTAALAVLPVGYLHPSFRALAIDGHDPYRDPATLSPLRLVRSVSAPTPGEARARADRAGWLAADTRLRGWDPLLVAVTGELVPARCTRPPHADTPAEPGAADAIFLGTREVLTRADLALMPLETSLSSVDPPTPCTETFVLQGSPDVAAAMARAGVDVVLPIGNHIGDCWSGCAFTTALGDTLEALDSAGLVYAGAGTDLDAAHTPAEVTAAGARVAILGYDDIAVHQAATDETPGVAPLDLTTLAADVRAAARRADYVIVGVNWGVEYTAVPTERQRAAARLALDAGASLVIGNHPHWVQALELSGEGLVVYALGNYLFDQDWSRETTESVLIEASFARGRLVGYRLLPAVIRGRERPELVDPATEGAPILRRMWEAEDRLLASPRE